ncbi:BgtTE-56014 [Blumeria graminis f. sp. tritici]|uniref:BgtTE-56014 n=1 Tax=Blumeria graminis f. sp. tritici TaxID=62690 RepID=A0A9X9PR40_BLUGR|nr:BgtTE-56014 [Blumeria graminis f. sp. tritici]
MTLLTLETLILWISFSNTTKRYASLHKQSTLLRKYPPKGSFKTFDYLSMPSSSMHTSTARKVIVFCRI